MSRLAVDSLPEGEEPAAAAREHRRRTGNSDSGTSSSANPLANALAILATYIPTEVIATYIVLVGLISAGDEAGRWWIFGAGLLIALVVGLANRPKRGDAAKKKHVRVMALSFVAFVVYAWALPATPFESISAMGSNASRIGSIVAIVSSVLMPYLAVALGIRRRAS